jgi:hypothetical protein
LVLSVLATRAAFKTTALFFSVQNALHQ